MSLPTFLSSSYKQYKEDTNCFTTWLSQAARACGYKSTLASTSTQKKTQPTEVITAPSQRLKGKARKLAKSNVQSGSPQQAKPQPKAVKHSVTTKELIEQVKAVVDSAAKKISLPRGIQAITERAISARQRCAAWFAQSGADVEANERHRHFIGVLQNALDTLKVAIPTVASAEKQEAGAAQDLGNRFDALELEEADEEYPLTPLDVSLPGAHSKLRMAPEVYELEDEMDEFEDAFALFCFFEDLHAIQEEIKKTWQRFMKGETTLDVATIVTQAGIDMAKRLEKEVLARRTNGCTCEDPYTTLAMPVFYAESMMGGEDPREVLNTPKALEHRPFHDFIYLPTARTLIKFANISHKTKDKTMWPPPVPPMRFSYIVRPELLELPEYKAQEEEDRILSQLLLDILLIDDTKDIAKQHQMDHHGTLPENEDELTKCARELWTSGRVSTSAVFASRITLDILKICGTQRPPRFHKELLEAGDRAQDTMGFFVDATGALDTQEVRWLTKDQQLIMGLYSITNNHIRNPTFPLLKEMMLQRNPGALGQPTHSGSIDDLPPEIQAQVRESMIARGLDPDERPTQEHTRNAEKLNIEMIRPADQRDFLQTHNALHCGSLSLKLSSMMEEAGISLANHHMSIFATAHLYNALRQLSLTEVEWPEMERIIDLHSGALFANDIPKTPTEISRRMAYRTGLTGPTKNFNQKQAWKFRTGVASNSLKQLFESKDTVENALLQLENQVSEHATPPEAIKRSQSKAIQGRQRQLKPIQLLSRFEEYLPIVLKDMHIDYVTLTKTCNKLMQQIRFNAQRELGMNYRSVKSAGDSNDHGFLCMILFMLEENSKAFTAYEKKKTKVPFKGSSELQLAKKTFEKFFRDGTQGMSIVNDQATLRSLGATIEESDDSEVEDDLDAT